MSQVHIYCRRRETIFLCRLLLNSHFSDCFLTILTEIELILRRSRAAMLELRSALKLLELLRCRDLPGSLSFRGVCSFSGCNFGGYVIMSEIGYKNKKDFSCSHEKDRRRGRIMFKESFSSPKSEQEIRIQ